MFVFATLLSGCGRTLNTTGLSSSAPAGDGGGANPATQLLAPVNGAEEVSAAQSQLTGSTGFKMSTSIGSPVGKTSVKTVHGYQVFLTVAGQQDSAATK